MQIPATSWFLCVQYTTIVLYLWYACGGCLLFCFVWKLRLSWFRTSNVAFADPVEDFTVHLVTIKCLGVVVKDGNLYSSQSSHSANISWNRKQHLCLYVAIYSVVFCCYFALFAVNSRIFKCDAVYLAMWVSPNDLWLWHREGSDTLFLSRRSSWQNKGLFCREKKVTDMKRVPFLICICLSKWSN